KVGGNTPQTMVNEWAAKLANGDASMVLLAGSEVIASTKAALKEKVALDWSEQVEGSLDDQGLGLEGLMTFHAVQHRVATAPPAYALCENVRRKNVGKDVAAYNDDVGELFAPFSEIAAGNPNAMFPKAFSAEEIKTVTDKNGYIAYPYTKAMVAKDGVNQAAAVLMTTVDKAKALGIDESKWVYLHSYAEAQEKPLLERPDLGKSEAMRGAYQKALVDAGITGDDLAAIDVYSCFPIVVFEAREALGLSGSDKTLTETGGLPFFGGPGNNYSMHGIAAVVRKLRQAPDSYGLVGANGGFMDKHSVGVYSCQPGWKVCDSKPLQKELDAVPAQQLNESPKGEAVVESYTVQFARGNPLFAIVVGRLVETGERFVANGFEEDAELIEALITKDMIGEKVFVTSLGKGNRVALTKKALKAFVPPKATALRDDYQYCHAKVVDHVLEVTINRPDAMNALHPMAHEELAQIFDYYEGDDSLWVAIITGAGEKAFCTGNDLKYSASGDLIWMPKSGFGGLTSRRRNKLVIAAVNGFAMGGGMEIALACDIVIAAENARFALPEVKVGLIAGAGGIQRLTRQIPLKQAVDMLVTGKQVTAEEGAQLGFINQVVPEGEALAAAHEYAKVVCENSPTAVRLTLETVSDYDGININDATQGLPKAIDKLFVSEDFSEGPKAFAQKRKPKWSGR
ncbi:MAG: enoyl-CoA hydratase-related protein, partial [bacterium]